MKTAKIDNEEYYDYVSEAFAYEARKDTDKLGIASLAIGGAIWAVSGNAIAGIAVGAGILYYSDRAIRQSNRALEFIQKNHVAAPFLPPDRLRDFEQQFGRETAVAQLKQAQEYGLRIAPAAEDCLEKWAVPAAPGASDGAGAIAPNSGVPELSKAPDPSGLHDRLRSECPEILKLVKAPPIRLVGHQRTGKSSFARKLALLRVILLPGHAAWWATPHREADNPVPAELNPVGFSESGKDFASIERLWKGTQMGIDRGNQLNQTTVWDEFGSYDQFSNPETLSGSLRSLLREATKHGYFPILIAHGDQASFYPGIAGIFKTLTQGTVKVESIGAPANDFGEMKPTGRFKVTQLDGQTSEFQVPGWLTEEYLLGIVRSRRTQPAPTEPAAPVPIESPTATQPAAPPPPPKLYQSGESDREALEKLLSLPAEFVEIHESEKVAPGSTLDDVETYIKERGQCPESAVKNWGKTRRKGALSSSEVEDLLIELVSLGRVESFTPPSGKGRWVRWIGTR